MDLSKCIEEGPGVSSTVKVTIGFLPPEKLRMDRNLWRVDDFAVDRWCLGKMVFHILIGHSTFSAIEALYKYQTDSSHFPVDKLHKVGASKTGIDFITKLMAAKLTERLKAEEANYGNKSPFPDPYDYTEDPGNHAMTEQRVSPPIFGDAAHGGNIYGSSTRLYSSLSMPSVNLGVEVSLSNLDHIPSLFTSNTTHSYEVHTLTNPLENMELTPEAQARRSVGDEVVRLPTIVVAASCASCTGTCRGLRGAPPSWQYNAATLLQVLVANPGAAFVQLLDVVARAGAYAPDARLVAETLDEFKCREHNGTSSAPRRHGPRDRAPQISLGRREDGGPTSEGDAFCPLVWYLPALCASLPDLALVRRIFLTRFICM
ncbi:hypothetical protein F5X99DRAFT_408608 [Biscogniauxia marginata]|nr:hypothetical protein F5X99DRAFT_408608 [Biscogniauxia marginata]